MGSVFKTYLDVVHTRLGADGALAFDRSTRPVTGDRMPGVGDPGGAEDPEFEDCIAGGHRRRTRKAKLEAKLIEISRRHDVYDHLALSLAPSIQTMSRKAFCFGSRGGDPRYRRDINVLLVGDPGTSISQVLQYVHKITPEGVRFWQGVISSRNNALSIAKAGIITTLNARTSILAAANPVKSRCNVNLPVTQNINLPPTLISCFDLLYLVLDQGDETLDRKLAQHLVGMYLEDATLTGSEYDILPLEDLAAYIDYSRNHINPVLSSEASDELVAAYVSLRSVSASDPRSSEKRITATTRQLESMIRLSEACARMCFATHVEAQDIQEACRLVREAIRTSAMDLRTGKIDMGLLNTGTGTGQRKLQDDMRKEILVILEGSGGKGKGIRWGDAVKHLAEQSTIGVGAAGFTEVIKAFENEGLLTVVGERDKRKVDGA
ncbi:hypothetical protein PISMIDRAFT_690617 [Pisolithus microcarpus 441]|uniref:MCM C-terminal AAA(+) ATPase domain-containing protein n=1 Tax=Pisolithus microcarpus 441 TaxID=765257 RepID=A0A0C9YT49_9AGAM|nr:hypothetical protein PISMIDRAFT_690625 [Pisolithus microcarpus 441]KIK11063.1 hypothetical protein PISMIDRAFT_690617 [Pisolithus microcarpus 441]